MEARRERSDLMLKVGSSGIRRRHESAGNHGCDRQLEPSPMQRSVTGNQQQSRCLCVEPGRADGDSGISASRPKDYVETREAFHEALLTGIDRSHEVDLVVLAGCLVVIPEMIVDGLSRIRIINIHPSLIPSFCGAGLLWTASA